METEDKIIPYNPTVLTGKRVLVLAPHPDDETIGCGGSLVHHVGAGDPVKVVFLTNGVHGNTSGEVDPTRYVKWRKDEAEKACACLGVTDLAFWPYEDRALARSRGAVNRMVTLLEDYRPELVYVPSVLEFHPDHRAACFLLCDAICICDLTCDVAFYEVGQPLSINRLVDITGVLPEKSKAIEAYKSQLKERPYGEVCLALNRYRSLTLSSSATHAEGYFLCTSELIRKVGPLSIPFHRAHRLAPDPEEAGPLVSIIVRTKDRPGFLANALRSIDDQTYANLEIVVVNDGGRPVRDLVETVVGDIPVTYIVHEVSLGRSAAANTGLAAARGMYINFLDDDDILYPDHVKTLVRCLETGGGKIAYTNVLSVHFEGPPERPQSRTRQVLNHDIAFDLDRLLFQNYLPLMGVMFHRDILPKVGVFDTELDLFEDWDFWIRASRLFPFHHIDKVTAEYRFYGADTTEAAHQEKYRYDEARARIFERVRSHLTGETWVASLKSEWFGELKMGLERAARAGRPEQVEASLCETNRRLQEARAAIDRLEIEKVAHQDALEAIHASRGWRWLNRWGQWKRRLGFPWKRQGSRGEGG
jgi:LmbE family N-acetylglucosaminyl deacetylase/glycosyltransferase involved in cell wall biosynthesis